MKEREILLFFSLERSYMSLNLNYQPEVVVVTENLSREDWLNYRRLGIGGSDCAAIMGVSISPH